MTTDEKYREFQAALASPDHDEDCPYSAHKESPGYALPVCKCSHEERIVQALEEMKGN